MPVATGLKNINYRVMTSDEEDSTPVYGSNYTLPEAIELNFDNASSMSSLFSDNKQSRSAVTLGEKKLSLSVADIPPADLARLLGIPYSGGVLSFYDEIHPPYVTIAANTTFDDGTVGYVRYYKVQFGYPNDADKTQEASVAYRPVMIEGRVLGLASSTYDGLHRIKMRDDDENVVSSDLTNFLTNVQYPGGDNGALSAAISKSSGNTRFTVTKSGGGNITLKTGELTADNLPIWSGGSLVAGTYAIASGNGTATVVVDFTPTTPFSGSQVIQAGVVGERVYDQNGVAIDQKIVTLTY